MSQFHTQIIESIEDIGANKWNNFIKQYRHRSIYCTYEWLKSLEEGLQMPPRHIVVTKEKTLIGALPCFQSQIGETPFQRLDSSRPGFGGPIVLTGEEMVLECLSKGVNSLLGGRVVSHRILSNNLHHLRYHKYLQEQGYRLVIDHSNLVFELGDTWPDTLARMKKNKRQTIRKEHVEPVILGDSQIEGFIDCANKILTRHHAKHLHSEFYHCLMGYFGEDAHIFAVLDGKEVLGGYLTIIDKYRETLRLIIGGVPLIQRDSGINQALFKEIIHFCLKKNLKYLDFGGSPADFRDGLFSYKDNFNSICYPIYTWEKGNIVWNIMNIGNRLVGRVK